MMNHELKELEERYKQHGTVNSFYEEMSPMKEPPAGSANFLGNFSTDGNGISTVQVKK